MPSIKDVDKLIINTVENETVYKYMEDNNLLQEDELYLVAGDSLPPITEEDNGKVLGVTNGEWQVVDQTSPLTPGTDYLTPTQISNSYVAKVNGKGLSTNDLTNELKAQYDKAEQNVQSDWNQTTTTSDDYIKNKPTKLSDFTDDLGASPTHTHSQYITDISGKVDKVSGKELSSNDLTNTLKTNYDAAYTHSQSTHAPSDAEKNVQSDWNATDANSDAFIKNKPSIPTKMSDLEQDVETGKIDAIKVNNVAQTITDKTVNISVPTALSGLTDDATHRLVTDTEKSTWNSKQNALTSQTAYSSKGSATKVPQITTNSLGQVTSISEVTITHPSNVSTFTNDANYIKAQNPSGTTDIATINADTLDGHPASYFAKASDVTPIDYVRNDDYRLSNARTPIAHTHSEYLSSDDVDDVKTEILSDVYTKEESYSAEQIDNAISSKANKPTKTTYTLLASKWDSNKRYSFESIYSSNEYDVDIQISSSATEEQLNAWSSAKIVSSNDLTNVIIATGEKPNVDIPTILVVNNISDTLEDSEGNIVTNYAIKSHIEDTTMHVTASEKELWDSKVDDFDPRLAKVETMLGGITNLETYIRDIVMQVLSEQ